MVPVPTCAGFDFVDPKAAAKNAKKRANKKKASGEAGQDDEDEGAASVAAAGVAALNVSAASQPSEGAAGEGAAGPDPEKRIRALQKKLRQIRDLKDKMAAQGTTFGTPGCANCLCSAVELFQCCGYQAPCPTMQALCLDAAGNITMS